MGKHIEFQELDELMSSYSFKTITELWAYINYLESEQKKYERLKDKIESNKMLYIINRLTKQN